MQLSNETISSVLLHEMAKPLWRLKSWCIDDNPEGVTALKLVQKPIVAIAPHISAHTRTPKNETNKVCVEI